MRLSFEAISISLQREGQPLLTLFVARDGTTKRMGSGTDSEEREMFVGLSSAHVFTKIESHLTESMLSHPGRFKDPNPKGRICNLTVIFTRAEGDVGVEFVYGSESMGPPREIVDLVTAAVELTDPWYEEQKELARGARKPAIE